MPLEMDLAMANPFAAAAVARGVAAESARAAADTRVLSRVSHLEGFILNVHGRRLEKRRVALQLVVVVILAVPPWDKVEQRSNEQAWSFGPSSRHAIPLEGCKFVPSRPGCCELKTVNHSSRKRAYFEDVAPGVVWGRNC